MKSIRWGILGTGEIARSFAEGLAVVDDAELVAIGSRSSASAEQFGERYNIPHRHDTYAALAANPDVDVVYVASPHSEHLAHSLLMLAGGKAVLCEKPFTINAAEAEQLVAAAQARGLFLMEAMWTRFLPHIVEVRRLLAEGAIGEVRMVQASFGIQRDLDPQHRLFNRELGGGALLDLGIYPVSLAAMIFGTPSHIQSVATIGSTGVDEQSAYLLSYPGGQIALLASAMRTLLNSNAVISGSTGRIILQAQWHAPSSITLQRNGAPDHTFGPTHTGNGYNYQIQEVHRCLRNGLRESPIMPLAETIAIMRTLDAIRAPWGLRYAADEG
jgi:predicted dehydrogenase